jgi:hypothetical protein
MVKIIFVITYLITTQYQAEQKRLGVNWADHDLTKNIAEQVEISDAIQRAATKYRRDYRLIAAVAWGESRLYKNAVSSAGARGIMQVLPRTAKRYKCNLKTIDGQIDCGTRVKDSYINWCNSVQKGLGAYLVGKCVRSRRAMQYFKLYQKLCRLTESEVF